MDFLLEDVSPLTNIERKAAMNRLIAPALLAACLLVATEAQGQVISRRVGVVSYPAGSYATAPTYPYSYYVALPNRARGYQSYGANDFPFHGQPYGHPYDPWTWPYMSRTYGRSTAVYFDPPVK